MCIIKLDVGGSHSKECELFGGEEYRLNLENPSGINPFEVLNVTASDNAKLGILSKFVGALISEQSEKFLSKSLRADLEARMRSYIETNPPNPSLDDFVEKTPHFPRIDLLKRWSKGGMYERAFAAARSRRAEEQSSVTEPAKSVQLQASCFPPPRQSRLRYYNFSQIFEAADPEFAQAGIAAVLAQFNIEMLRAAESGKRIVLICDETPFFIRSCFEFFKLTTANVRKYGHASVLIAQLSSDFVVQVDAGGKEDVGIIESSPQRFFFSMDGEEKVFKERFSLNDEQIEQVKGLQSVVGVCSEVLFQTEEKTRKLTVKVTPEEYWRLTTSRVDKEKLMNLLAAVPGLSMREAIRCLANL